MNQHIETLREWLPYPTNTEHSVTILGVKEIFDNLEACEGHCTIKGVDFSYIESKIIQ